MTDNGRVEALNEFIQSADAKSLIESNKRIANILKDSTKHHNDLNSEALIEDSEKNLYKADERYDDWAKPFHEKHIAQLFICSADVEYSKGNFKNNNDFQRKRIGKFGSPKNLTLAKCEHLNFLVPENFESRKI